MATSCPCCGMRVGFSRRIAGKNAEELEDMLPLVKGLAARAGEGSTEWKVCEDGQLMLSLYVDHIHKRAKPGTHPDLLTLNKQFAGWRVMVNRLIEGAFETFKANE